MGRVNGTVEITHTKISDNLRLCTSHTFPSSHHLTMPPKIDLNDPAVAELVTLFQSIGLERRKAADIVGSAKTSQSLSELIETNGLATKKLDAKRGTLISGFAVQAPKLDPAQRTYVVQAIVDEKLKTADQVSGALLSPARSWGHN